ncbi:MAG: hypothetical protein WBB43_07385, partial [Limnoraphis sp.]
MTTEQQISQQEFDQLKSELHDTREELERIQAQFDEVLGELEQTHFQLHQIQQQEQSSSDSVQQELT